jgi:hypothetical protein
VVGRVGTGDRLPRGTKRFGAGVRRSGRYLFGVKRGRVRWVAVTSRSGLRSARASLKLAGLV